LGFSRGRPLRPAQEAPVRSPFSASRIHEKFKARERQHAIAVAFWMLHPCF
jgi:hypothetical protein